MANLFSKVLGSAVTKATSAVAGIGTSVASNRYRLAAYLGGGALASAYTAQRAEELKAYYGDQEFGRRFGTAFDTVGAAIPLATLGATIGTFGRYDPIGMLGRAGRSVAKTALAPIGMAARSMGRETPQFLQALKRSGPGIRGPAVLGGLGMLSTAGAATLLSTPGISTGLLGLGAAAGTSAVFGAIAARSGLGYAAGSLAVSAVGLGAARIASAQPNRQVAEGYISDWRVAEQSAVRKMDFNTAGLGLALHHNRRM